MKSLILVLLLTVSAQAQTTVAEAARKERERQARIGSARVITSEGAQRTLPVAASAPPEAGQGPVTNAETPKPTSAAAPQPPAAPKPEFVDPAAQWNQQMNGLRTKVQQLQDQEAALQLQLNQLTNQFFAPVTDQGSKDQAQVRLGETQNTLTIVRAELDQTRRTLEATQLQGPPKP